MFSLRRSRLRGDMTEVFKMIHSTDKVILEKFFCIDEDERTRKHSFCLKTRRHVNSNIGLKFFTNYNYWNHLTYVVVSCKNLSIFEIKLDKFMTAKGEI